MQSNRVMVYRKWNGNQSNKTDQKTYYALVKGKVAKESFKERSLKMSVLEEPWLLVLK